MKISEKGMNIAKISLKFKNLLSKGNVNGALKLLTENMLNGILLLTDKTLQILKQKHPKANEPASKTLLQGQTCPIHQIKNTFQKCSYKKVLWKYAANLQEITHAEVRFQ